MVYKLGRIIGRGSDGVVYELLTESSDDKVIKFIQGETFGIKNYIEYYILNNLDEKYITKCHKVEIEDDGLIKIIFDKADCDLKDYITKNKLKTKKKKDIMKQLIEGLEYLQSFNIIHGDIKPSNILVFGDSVKYSDFNLSKVFVKNNEIDRKLYTLIYRSPEATDKKLSLKSDIWALGCTFHEIYYGHGYFNYSKDKKFFHMKNCVEIKEENEVFNDLIKNMICEDENNRFSINQVKNHPFFSKEKFLVNFKQKEILDKLSFVNLLKENYSLYNIQSAKDINLFCAKVLNFSCIPIHKKYKNIENKICQNNFKLKIFS